MLKRVLQLFFSHSHSLALALALALAVGCADDRVSVAGADAEASTPDDAAGLAGAEPERVPPWDAATRAEPDGTAGEPDGAAGEPDLAGAGIDVEGALPDGSGPPDGAVTAVGAVLEGPGPVLPVNTLHLAADASLATRFAWRVQQPPGAQSRFVPNDEVKDPTFEVNVSGTYTFYLGVWDANGTPAPSQWSASVLVLSTADIHVELTWDTPQDPDETDEGPEAGSDLDLHFVHLKYADGGGDFDGDGANDPWFGSPFDCFWFNPAPNWGVFDPEITDDPTLDIDDTDGAGPENLSLWTAQTGEAYGIGVHYWADHGFGDATATLRVWIQGAPVFEATQTLSPGDLWNVLRIEWPTGSWTAPAGPGGATPWVTSDYSSPLFVP